MKAKKKLLFVNDSLGLAGGEKSLIALLSKMDSSIYDVDLQLFRYGGELEQLVPSFVNILPEMDYTLFSKQTWMSSLKITSKKKAVFLYKRIKYSLLLRIKERNIAEVSQLFWENFSSVFGATDKHYDVAIAYSQGVPTYYVMDKINAKRKIAWLNVNQVFPPENLIFQKEYYSKYDNIVAVSEGTNSYLNSLFPEMNAKIVTIKDIIDYKLMERMSQADVVKFQKSCFNILTVARLNDEQKGYDITLEACKQLKERGLKFHWYAIGEGPYRSQMEKYIKQNELSNYFTLLGTMINPYPYFRAADLYVQTSRHEGFGLSIAEARLLNIPVVTTRFDTVLMQMVHEKNGLVVEIDATEVADAIWRMVNDKQLYKSIIDYLRMEEKENFESVQQFYQLVNM